MPVRLTKQRLQLLFVAILIGLSITVLVMKTVSIGDFQRGSKDTPLGLRLGLDLQGGTHLVYRAQTSGVTKDQMQGVADAIERRVNGFGIAEAVVQLKGANEVVVQLPGVKDIDEAKRLIGSTAQLDFRRCAIPNSSAASCPQWVPATGRGNGGIEKHLTGKFMRPTSELIPNPSTGLPEVAFEFNSEGASIFEQITSSLIGQPLGIFLDNQLISAPTVQSTISDRGRITGLSTAEGRRLAIQLNAGALPVDVRVVREEAVSATLGKDSLDKSYVAAAIGLGLVMLFMILYYRLPGLDAAITIAINTVIILAIFKMLNVTLTLPGIAGFVVSIGMSVDANVLIYERMREELRGGRGLGGSIATGFDRAWSAIRDSNMTTIITMAILWWFGDRLGEPKVTGFAITVIISLLVGMFCALFISRLFLKIFVGTKYATRTSLFAPVKIAESPARTALGA
jgi:preprotein translocase subunit SecD